MKEIYCSDYGHIFTVFVIFVFQGSKKLFRFVILLCGGLFATFGSRVADIAGAGALGCLTMAFVAAFSWRKEVGPDQDVSTTNT